MKKIFTDNLPKWQEGKNKGSIDWSTTPNYKVKFIYDDIEGEVEIIEYIKKKYQILIKYNNKTQRISTSDFKSCRIGKILGKITLDFKIEIGQVFQDNKRDITIQDREYRENPYNKGKFLKWYRYTCNKCGWTEGWIIENELLQGTGCSCCYNRTIVKGINDIATTHPYMVKFFKDIKDAYTHSFCSGEKVWMKCPDCGYEEKIKISNLYTRKFSCKKCGDGISFPNKFMLNLLNQLNLEFVTEYNPEWCRYLYKNKIKKGYYDFYIPSMNLIIEMDGGWHTKDNSMSGQTAKDSKIIDDEKDILAEENGIDVIRINCDYKDYDRFEYIKQSIYNNTEFNKLFNINNIDWMKINEFLCSNLIKIICYFKKDNIEKSTTEIGIIFNLSRTTIKKYLKIGNKLNWCSYDEQEERRKAQSKNYKSKQIIVFDKYNNMIGSFSNSNYIEINSIKLFGVQLYSSHIRAVCMGKRKTHKGYTFKYE